MKQTLGATLILIALSAAPAAASITAMAAASALHSVGRPWVGLSAASWADC